jgi:C-terminal processing protease CtpA/Prc
VSKAKGLAALASTLALTAACTLAAVAAPSTGSPETPDVREKILQLLEQGALYRDQIDWPSTRQQIRQANDPTEADKLLDDVIARSTGNHGRWIRASTMANTSGMQRTAQASQLRRPAKAAGSAGPAAARNGDADPIGWISVPAFKEDSTAAPPVRYQQQVSFAQQLQTQLRAEDQRDRCGWIVDLRANQGGNMWPMILGVAPLLSTHPEAKEIIGAFNLGKTHQVWSLQSGRVMLDERMRIELASPPYVLHHPAPAVAVLFGSKTASSGEMMALAFRGRPTARSFGQPTAGLSTANNPVRLTDGSMLLLTGSVAVDRNFKGDGGKLQPDVSTSDSADAEAAARRWLMEQPACLGAARAP